MSVNFGVQQNVRFSLSLVRARESIHADGIDSIVKLTQAQYDALETYSSSTLYLATQTNGTVRLYLGTAALWEDPTTMHSEQCSGVIICTQEEYDAITQPDEGMLYVIRDGLTATATEQEVQNE